MRFRFGIALSFVLVPVLSVYADECEMEERVGYAYDRKSGEFLYTEAHCETSDSGRITGDTVTYRGPQGTVFAEKRVDFTSDPFMPNFELDNPENGHLEGARESDGKLTIHFRESVNAPLREQSLAPPGSGIIDAGFDRFIEEKWDRLRQDQIFVREFLLPSRLDFLKLRVRRVREKEHDPNSVVFFLESASAILRMFLEPVIVTYDANSGTLRRYEGISNMRDALGNNYDVRIDFPHQTLALVEQSPPTPMGELVE